MTPTSAAKSLSQSVATGDRLREQLELYQKIFANSIDSIAILDARGCYLEQNPAHREMTGYSDSELADKTPAIHLGEETFRKIAAALKANGNFRGEALSRSRTGTVRNIELCAFPVCNEHGEPRYFVGIKRDITERARAEAERESRLRELETVCALAEALNRALSMDEVYAAALDALAVVTGSNRASILLYDETGVMRFKAWRGLSDGYRRAVEGHSPWAPTDASPPPIAVEDVETEPALEHLRSVIRREHIRALAFIPICHERRLLGKFMVYFGEVHSFSAAELKLAEAIAAHIGFAIHRYHTEEALHRSEKLAAAGRLAATVAHEINNPLEAVTNLLFLAKTEASIDQVRSYLTHAERELARVSQISRQTLAFYRDNGMHTSVDLVEILDSAVAIYRSRLQERSIRVERQYGRDTLKIMGSAGELRQLFSNLIVNAIDASLAGGCIRVEGKVRQGMVEIEITDNGAGISPQHMAHIFEPFFTTKEHVGTGLGLWVAREVARKHSGSLELFSNVDPETHGTRAVVCLALPSA
jgi:PAS domain S-box-containing protein